MRLYLMGIKGFSVLEYAIRAGYGTIIEDVVYARDKNVLDDRADEIILACRKNDILYYERSEAPPSQGMAIAISWRWIIPQCDNLIVLHDSLLPRYRGFAPLVTALKNGEPVIGVTALYASEKYDDGPILFQESTPITYPITIRDAIALVSALYIRIVAKIFESIQDGRKLEAVPQNHSRATYSLWLNDEDYFIDWTKDSQAISRHVDATGFPYLGAKTMIGDNVHTVLAGKAVKDVMVEIRKPGKVIYMDGGKPIVVCGRGLYRIDELKDEEGENALPLKNFRTQFE